MSDETMVGGIFTKSCKYRIIRAAKLGDRFVNNDGTQTVVAENRGNLWIAVPTGTAEILVCSDGIIFDELKMK